MDADNGKEINDLPLCGLSRDIYDDNGRYVESIDIATDLKNGDIVDNLENGNYYVGHYKMSNPDNANEYYALYEEGNNITQVEISDESPVGEIILYCKAGKLGLTLIDKKSTGRIIAYPYGNQKTQTFEINGADKTRAEFNFSKGDVIYERIEFEGYVPDEYEENGNGGNGKFVLIRYYYMEDGSIGTDIAHMSPGVVDVMPSGLYTYEVGPNSDNIYQQRLWRRVE